MDKIYFEKILILCGRDAHRTRAGVVRKKLLSLPATTEKLKGLVNCEEADKDEIVKQVAELVGMSAEKFGLKLNSWLSLYDAKLWCTMCGERPVRKGNRRFCSACFIRASNKENIHTSGGHKISRTGGTGRQP